MNIAIFGQGIIGSRCADRYATAGYQVTRWSQRAFTENSQFSPNAAVETSTVLASYLKSGHDLRQWFEIVRPQLRVDHLVMNHATIDLATTHWLAAQCAEIGCHFVDAPFTGSKVAAENGQLFYYLAGESGVCEQAARILQPTARATQYFGAVGNATIMKLANNHYIVCCVQAMAESQALATRFGIDVHAFNAAIQQSAAGCLLTNMKLPTMAVGDFSTHFSLTNMLKDARYALELAGQAGLNLPALENVAARMNELCLDGHGEADFSALSLPYQPLTNEG